MNIEELLAGIIQRLARIEEIVQPAEQKIILTTEEAMVMAGYQSKASFSRWTTKYRVENSGNGRWPRERIEMGLVRESKARRAIKLL